ncbi:tail protein [Bacillus phage PK2]|nr:tail protein [Bacillus phage PK2]
MKKTNILVFDGQSETLLTTLSNKDNKQCPFNETDVVEQLNKDFTFEFTVPATHEDARHLVRGNLVGYFDLDGNLQVFQIYKTEEQHTGTELEIKIFSEHLFYEMTDDIVTDLRVNGGEALEAMTKALSSSRWEVGQVDSLGTGTLNFYYSNAVDNITNVANTFGGELGFRFVLDGNRISQRLVDLKVRRGADTGKRFEFFKDMESVKRTVQMDGLKTALYGRGKGEEIEDTNGYSRKITFADIDWRLANGDPVDKPLGQEWVGLPEALEKFGREGGTRHRFGIFDVDSTDPREILELTFQELQRVSTPKVTYELKVITLEQLTKYEHEKVRLGDTVFVIDRELGLTIEARVVEIKRDLINPENTEIILGNFIEDITDFNEKILEVEATITDRKGVWDKVDSIDPTVDDTNIVDILPNVPANVSAQGLFKSIVLKWTFDPSIAISAYEVYGSKVNNFTPDSSNLLFRGKSGGFVLDANTNETWYFRLRAINPHGKVSGFTQQFQASTIALTQPDFENLTVTNAMIENVSGDKITFGTIDGNQADIVNLNADNIAGGRVKSKFLEIGSETIFANGYDPTTKATPQDVTDAESRAKDYSKPVMREFYDKGFEFGKEFWTTASPHSRGLPSATVGTIKPSPESEIGGNVWELEGQHWLYSQNPIPINVNRVYRVTFRVRQTRDGSVAGTNRVYAGVATLDENLLLLTGGAGTHRYCAVAGTALNVEDGWQTFSGLITGVGDTHDTFRDGTRYVRPLFVVSYTNGDGLAEVDFVEFEDVTEIVSLEERVVEVEFKTTNDSIVSTVTDSAIFQEQMSNKVDQTYVEENFANLDNITELEERIGTETDEKINALGVPEIAQRVSNVEQTAQQIDFKFTNSGGVNLLQNSVGYAGTDFWDVEISQGKGMQTLQNNELAQIGAGSGWFSELGSRSYMRQKVSVVNSNRYTLSFYMKKTVDNTSSGWAGVDVFAGETKLAFVGIGSGGGTTNGWEKFEFSIDTDLAEVDIAISIGTNAEAVITNLMLNIGDVPLQWTLASGEVYNTNVLMDMNGVRVISDQYEGYTAITPKEFSGYAEVEGNMERVFTLNKDTTEMNKARMEQEISMSPVKVVPVTSFKYNGWAFISDSSINPNLVSNTDYSDGMTGWSNWGTISTSFRDETESIPKGLHVSITSTTGSNYGIQSPTFYMRDNTVYTVSFTFQSFYNTGYDIDYLYLRDASLGTIKKLPNFNLRVAPTVYGYTTAWRVEFTIEHNATLSQARLLIGQFTNGLANQGFILREFKVEEGDRRSQWVKGY